MSSLTQIFGGGHNAYFSNGPLSRLSFLRTQTQLLDQATTHASAKYLTFDELNPLRQENGSLAFVCYSDVKDVVGRPFRDDEKTKIANFDPAAYHPLVIFLGLDLNDSGIQLGSHAGTAYFALDMSSSHCDPLKKALASKGLKHTPTRIDLNLSHAESAIYSHARSLLDWNTRNRFCSSCGGRTLSTHAGTKVICPPADNGVPRQRACPTRVGLHNQAFPRTDPTIVVAPVSADSKRVLLGRAKRWPENYFSCLSGFAEPGESLETATRREAYEEAGVIIDKVHLHSSQPFPYPSTMLIGTIGQCAEGGENIVYHESELDEAKWFELNELDHALGSGANPMWEPPIKGYTGVRLPPSQLMAHQVLKSVVRLFRK